jgi:hypothetical protein
MGYISTISFSFFIVKSKSSIIIIKYDKVYY